MDVRDLLERRVDRDGQESALEESLEVAGEVDEGVWIEDGLVLEHSFLDEADPS